MVWLRYARYNTLKYKHYCYNIVIGISINITTFKYEEGSAVLL